MLGNRLLKAMEKDFGEDCGLVFQRISRTIAHKGKLVAKVEAVSYDDVDVTVQGVMHIVRKLKLNKDAILADSSARIGSAPNVTWSA